MQPENTTNQKRTKENKGDEVQIRERAATFLVGQLTVCITCTSLHDDVPVFTCCGPV